MKMQRYRSPRPAPIKRLRSQLREPGGWRSILLALRRNQVARIGFVMVIVWIADALAVHWVERRDNPEFANLFDSFWNVFILMFSGPENQPRSVAGRLLSMVVLGLGVALAGLFTGSVASVFVTQNLRSRDVSNFEMEDHLILCNWSERGLPWIREVHSKIIQDKRPVVIIHDKPELIDLPDKQDDATPTRLTRSTFPPPSSGGTSSRSPGCSSATATTSAVASSWEFSAARR